MDLIKPRIVQPERSLHVTGEAKFFLAESPAGNRVGMHMFRVCIRSVSILCRVSRMPGSRMPSRATGYGVMHERAMLANGLLMTAM